MWIAVFLSGLAVYLVSDHKQPLTSRSSSIDGPKEGLLLWRDGTAHQVLQVVAAASCERIDSPLKLPSHLREPREQNESKSVHIPLMSGFDLDRCFDGSYLFIGGASSGHQVKMETSKTQDWDEKQP